MYIRFFGDMNWYTHICIIMPRSFFTDISCHSVEEGALEGKLSCAHCDARLGYFNWAGIQCSCGSWITPAFQLHKSRVDISHV